MFLTRAWNFIIEDGICPWMSKQVESQLMLQSKCEQKHQMRSRMYMYYMFIRKRNENVKRKRKLRKLAELQAKQQQDSNAIQARAKTENTAIDS